MKEQVSEKEYRAVKLDSSSSVKDFSSDRRKYYRKYILNETVKEKEVKAAITGQVVETLLLEPDLFDDKFYMSSCVSIPTHAMLSFVEAMYKCTKEHMAEDGTVDATFEEISRAAHEESDFKLKYEAVINKFADSDAAIYFEEICTVRENNLTVINAQDVQNAQKIVDELRENPITAPIVNLSSSQNITVLDQYTIFDYEIDGVNCKSMLDRIIINHTTKKIKPFDLKCTWSVENFLNEYFLYRRSYIQAYFYNEACLHLIKTTPELTGYTVEPLKFIVCDSINYFSPLVYEMNQETLKQAYEGFSHNQKKYPGVKEILSNLKWAKENDIWNIPQSAHSTNGLITIKYD